MRLAVVTSIGEKSHARRGFPRTVLEFAVAGGLLGRGHDLCTIIPGSGELADALRELGVDVVERSYAGQARNVWRRAARMLGTAALARRLAGADCVVGFRLSSTLLALDLGKRLGVPVMAFLQGHTDRAEKYQNHGCHRADLVAAPSRAALDAYARASAGRRSPLQRLELIPNGIDAAAFCAAALSGARAAAGIPEDVPLVGIAGATERKGIDLFVAAAARLADRHPRAHFLVCGEFRSEELQREVHATAERAGLAHRFHWVGFQEHIAGFMRASDVWTMPSRNDAAPLVGLEVAAAGRPIVASAVGGIPEMVREGETGFLVPSGDAHALADRLDTLLGDPALRERMGQRAATLVRAEFSLPRLTDRFEQCLRSLTEPRTPAAVKA